MEDNGRELDPDPVNTPPVRIGYPSSKELTIMLIGSVGKTRSFKISRKLIIYASVFFLLFIAFSLFIFYSYLDLYATHKVQSNNLLQLEADLSDKAKALEKSRLYIKVLEDYRKGTDEKSDSSIARKTPEKSSPEGNVPNDRKNKETSRREQRKKAADTDTTQKKAREQESPEVKVPSEEKSQETDKKEPEIKIADTGKDRNDVQKQSSTEESAPGESKSTQSAQYEPEAKAPDTDITQKKSPEQGPAEDSSSGETRSQAATQEQPEAKIPDADAILKESLSQSSPEDSVQRESDSQAATIEETVTDPMEVRDINFRRDDSELTLNFILANKLAEEKTAEGFIHIIVMNKNKDYPPEWNNAYNKLSKGFPVNFSHGQQFLIQRYRPYQRKYNANPDSELPSFIRILVYDRSGQKILEKEFPVTEESTNDPG